MVMHEFTVPAAEGVPLDPEPDEPDVEQPTGERWWVDDDEENE